MTRTNTAPMALACLALALSFPAGATNGAKALVDCEDPSAWTGDFTVNTEVKRSGKMSFELVGTYPKTQINSPMMPIDLDKTYRLSVWMRSLDADLPASANFGLKMYDANKRFIGIRHVTVRPDTATTLAEDAAEGDKELLVAKNANWLKEKHMAVAFNAKDDFSDLPNYDVARVTEVVEDGERLKATLRDPLKQAYPAGTKVRIHSPWGAALYNIANGCMPAEWKEFSATFQGEATGSRESGKFWPGARYVQICVWYGNYNRKPEEGARLLVDDIAFTRE